MFEKMFDWPHDTSFNKNVPTEHHSGPKSNDIYIAPIRLYGYTRVIFLQKLDVPISLTTLDLKKF